MSVRTLNFPIRALALAVVLPAAAMASNTTYSSEEEALFLKRYAEISNITGRGLEAYAPLEPVAGARFVSLPKARSATIAPEALQTAENYAAERGSSALIVWRGGKIEAEHYFNGYDATKPIVSKSLAKPVTALLIGRAIKLGYIKSLDQPVADFITEWKGDASRGQMKIRHLLDMTSGLDWSEPMLERAAEYLEREFSTFTAVMLSLIEPAIIVVMGGVVALIVLSILLPILQINTLAMG